MANEIKFYLSGGSSNTNPFLSIGGSISNTEITNGLLNNLWSDVSESDSTNGVTDHRVIFVKNVSGAPLADMRAYFGELDNFVGLAILNSTTPNTAVAQLAAPTDAITGYAEVWANTGESPVSRIDLNDKMKRVVLYIANTKHAAYNQYPDQVSIMMAKTGSPTGTATVKVWAMASGVIPSSTDNTVIRTLGTIDVSGLPTTFTKKTFNTVADVVQNPLPGVGWRIGIEYTGGTATNAVNIGQTAQVATASAPGSAGTAATSQAWLMISLNRTDTDSGFDSVNGASVLLSHEIAEACSDPAAGTDYQEDSNFNEQDGWIDVGIGGQGEISDICDNTNTGGDVAYSDGLHVNAYWDNKGKKCVAKGAMTAKSVSGSPNVTFQGCVTPPAPKIVLIFWGTTWNSSNNSKRTGIIDAIQNKLLNSDKQFWDIGVTDYNFGMPTWGGAAVWNQDPPADPSGNGYTEDEVSAMFQNFIHSSSVPASPLSSIYASQGVNISNYIYNVLPDPTWKLDAASRNDFAAFHAATVYTATASDPTPPPVETPPPTGGGGGPGSSSPKGGYSQAWDGSKWVDFAANSPAMDIYTNFGACFQPGNPPPVGGGPPPPGECGASSPAPGTVPVAGGGGGAAAHGYTITSATDNGNDGNQATNVFDHNLATRWSQNSTNALLTVDMGQNHPIDRVKLAWYKGDERQAKFNLSFSTDNTTFISIPPSAGGGPPGQPPPPPPPPTNPPPVTGPKTDRTNLSFSNGTYTSEYHLYAADLDWNKAVGMLLYTDGSAEFGLKHPSDSYLMAGTNGMIAIAKKHNMILLTPLSPNKACADGDGSCWYQGDPPGYAAWVEALVNFVYSQYPIDRNRIACGGYSSGAQFNSEYWVPSGGAQRTMSAGVIVMISFGGKPQMTEVSYTAPFKTNVHMHWDTGVNDDSWLIDDPTEGPNSGYNGKAGYDYYSSHGFQTSFVLVANTDHLRDGDFGHIMDMQIGTYVRTAAASATPSATPMSNFVSSGKTLQLEEFSFGPPKTARFLRYTGLGNTLNNWNSVTELEIYGSDVPDQPPGGPPPPGGINYSKPSSYDTGVPLPNLTNGDFVAIHLERAIPAGTQHSEVDNYSIVISNEPHPAPPPDEPIPPGGGGTPIGEVPVPSPPGVFDPGIIPPPQEVPPPPPPGQCPGPPDQPPPPPDNPPPGGGGGGGVGVTPDGIKLVELPAGRTYGDQHTNFHENFQSNGSFRLDIGVQPQLDELNLTFYLNLSSGSDEISSKLSGGTHTDSKAKNGRCYDIGLAQAGNRVRIRKEDPHPSYHDGPSHSINLGSLNGKWVGVQSLKWNEGSNCHLQCWVDTSGAEQPTNKWSQILDDVDTGGWFEAPYLHCFDSSDSQTTIRVDSMSTSKFHYKFLCATRIK